MASRGTSYFEVLDGGRLLRVANPEDVELDMLSWLRSRVLAIKGRDYLLDPSLERLSLSN